MLDRMQATPSQLPRGTPRKTNASSLAIPSVHWVQSLLSSAGCRLPGGEVVESWPDCMVLNHHHFENGLAAANFLPNGQDRALRRSLLDDRRNPDLGHRQRRVILRRWSDVRQVGKRPLLRGPGRRRYVAYVLVEGIRAATGHFLCCPRPGA